MPVLFRRHDAASQARYQDLKQLAHAQRRVLAGTPGTLKQRTQAGNRYWVREHLRVDGKKTDEYIGAVKSVDPAAVERLSEDVELAKALAAGSAQLRLLGHQRLDRQPAAVLAALFNRGLFRAGLTLVGSHAYGALLNELGITAAGYKTHDIDLARGHRLEIALPEQAGFDSMLAESGLRFVPVPGMPSHRPSASFKLPGAGALAVDLLVPGRRTGEIVKVAELGAHAQTVALLDYLVKNPIESVCLSPNQVIPVRVPAPERFLTHKLFASQSRGPTNRDKARKDLVQAATLAAAIEAETPGRIADAYRAMPAAGKAAARRGATAASRLLDAHPHAQRVLARLGAR
ncbi:MAG TPA: GSU2403 family nucleotidyltransferase fold protein [Burkholderiales bacterium]|nr:GSU2403 family nucleotidyltransferase fold protein [Burkholderiales bacterium]